MASRLSLRKRWISPPLKAPLNVLSEDVPASKTIPPDAKSDYEKLKLMTLIHGSGTRTSCAFRENMIQVQIKK